MISLHFEKLNNLLNKNKIVSVDIINEIGNNIYDEIKIKYSNGKCIFGVIRHIEDLMDLEINLKILIEDEKNGDIPESKLEFSGIDKDGNIILLETLKHEIKCSKCDHEWDTPTSVDSKMICKKCGKRLTDEDIWEIKGKLMEYKD